MPLATFETPRSLLLFCFLWQHSRRVRKLKRMSSRDAITKWPCGQIIMPFCIRVCLALCVEHCNHCVCLVRRVVSEPAPVPLPAHVAVSARNIPPISDFKSEPYRRWRPRSLWRRRVGIAWWRGHGDNLEAWQRPRSL